MDPTPMINPRIVEASQSVVKDWEGCLSVPGIRGLVPRSEQITVAYTDRQGVLQEAQERDEGSRMKGALREGTRYVAIDVEDNGPGIEEEKLAKIFDPFFTTKSTGVGTGLGLSVVRKIMDLHQGMIEIVNRPEGGVRATLTFQAV